MISRRFWGLFIGFALGVLQLARADPGPDKSPSWDKMQWLGTKTSLETTAEYHYVFAGKTSLGNGLDGHVAESQVLIRQLITRRCLRAFLVRGGLEWERFDFQRTPDAFLPANLHVFNLYLATDFRFSYHDMIRIQARPGAYTDYEKPDFSDFNMPFAVAYSHMVSRNFQWALGVSVNRWRKNPYLAGGGFRWQINDRWKLKMMLPEPQLEYKPRDDLHVFMGGDFRGDTFRVASDFGTRRGRPALDNALVDYQELRAGMGFSWNVKPLIEINFQTGYMLDRAFNYHNNGVLLVSDPSPYINLSFRALFELWKEEAPSLETRTNQFEIPDLNRVLPNVPKIFGQ